MMGYSCRRGLYSHSISVPDTCFREPSQPCLCDLPFLHNCHFDSFILVYTCTSESRGSFVQLGIGFRAILVEKATKEKRRL